MAAPWVGHGDHYGPAQGANLIASWVVVGERRLPNPFPVPAGGYAMAQSSD